MTGALVPFPISSRRSHPHLSGEKMTPAEKLARFEEQALPHLKSAYNLAHWLTRNREDAEDVAQEAFVRAFSAFENFRGGDIRPWLLAIVRNTCLTWMKRNRTETVALDERLHIANDRSPGPEEILLGACDRDQVRNALEQLPSDFREALVLREMEGLSYKEIAEVAGVPLGTVMSRLSRGRDWMKRLLSAPAFNPRSKPE